MNDSNSDELGDEHASMIAQIIGISLDSGSISARQVTVNQKGLYMQTIESTGRIRITSVPEGESPLEIRQAWVGLVLPCDPILGYPDGGHESGVLSGKETSHNQCGFSVPQDQAIAILEQVRSEAAAWWKEHGFPQPGKYFGFSEGEAEIVSGVARQTLVEVTDEMKGNPNR